ncbi:MAG TPA: STAS/SEC14 domain-containing protein [Bryobacteraceae bacterium]|nr:STAS/SEC14 domain-containing protein [Bryobacteraceae bacterium]
MAIEMKETHGGKVLELQLTGKLAREDYEKFVPEVERLVERHGKIRMLVEMHDFHGWSAGAMWEDTKFAVQYFSDIERLAVVGETKWQEGLSLFAKPFTAAEVRYFDRVRLNEARDWLGPDQPPTGKEEPA